MGGSRESSSERNKTVTPTPILFVDLDGTIRYNGKVKDGFIHTPDEVEIYDGVVDILKSYKAKGWRIVSINNQGGIAMGFMSEQQVARNMQETNRMCANLFDRMYWCIHHPKAEADEFASKEEKSICLCRKPRIGYVINAMLALAEQYGDNYKPYACLFVGDRAEDRGCAENSGIPFMDAETWRKNGPV